MKMKKIFLLLISECQVMGEYLKQLYLQIILDSLNSCRGWAGKNCGLSDAQKAEFARLAALAKAKAECISEYAAMAENNGW